MGISDTYIKGTLAGFLFLLVVFRTASAQDLMINEVMASNSATIADEDGDFSDWIELYNAGNSALDLQGYAISDSSNLGHAWVFPEVEIGAGDFLLLFASDKDRRSVPLNWETVIDWGDEWHYLVPQAEVAADWTTTGFDDSSWQTGPSGFGYGDNDDSTVLPNVMSVFIRTTFSVDDPAEVEEILFHIDYDDGFVAYINGTEIARANITSQGPPPFDQFADNYDHEPRMFQGGQPDLFAVSNVGGLLVSGENVLAVQVHNANEGSSDLTAIPFLSLGTSHGDDGLSEHLTTGTKNLHTNFKISSDGEFLLLLSPAGELVDSLYTRDLPVDASYGRSPDGGDNWSYFGEATPAQPNANDGVSEIGGKVSFAPEGGNYSGAFELTLSASGESDRIYYTTDGSSPEASGTLYSGPFSVNKTMVVRAQVVNDKSLPGRTGTQTYFINTSHDLPVISIATDPDNLWDHHKGIYVMGPNAQSEVPHYGANFWQDWEKPVHIEMYEPGGQKAFAQDAGVQIFGAWSRAHAQKSLAIFARDRYGSDRLQYQIFPELDMDEFSSLVLRNSGNDWNFTMFRDALMTSLFHEAVDKQVYRPAVIYINGDYWGIQNIREKVNEDFLGSHHGFDPDSITILEANAVPVEGNADEYNELISFVSNNDLSLDANYNYVKERVDIFNYIQYMTGNIYIDNKDWPGNNIKFWKANHPGEKWRWIAYDTDFGFDIYNQGNASYNTLAFAMEPYGPDWPNPPWSTLLFRSLLQNEEFKNEFINAFADRLNTAWLPENVLPKIKAMKAEIASELGAHLERWNGDPDWSEYNADIMINFAESRPNFVRQHIRSAFGLSAGRKLTLQVNNNAFGKIRLNTITPSAYPWEGTYFQGAPVTLQAIPSPGYRFVRWEGDANETSETITLELRGATSVRAVFEERDTELTSIVINEINYNPADDFDTEDWIELYNKGAEAINMSGWVLKDDDDSHEFIFAEGIVLESGEFLVVCRDREAFSELVAGVTSVGDMTFGLSGGGDCVRLYTDQLVLTDEVCFQSVNPWPFLPDGNGATLALKNPSLDNSNPENWYALGENGNPGEGNQIDEQPLSLAGNGLNLYPNPVNGEYATITYNMSRSGILSLKIFNEEGRLIRNLYEGNEHAGRGAFRFQLSPVMQPGVYFIRMESVGRKTIFRFIRE